MKKNFGIVLLAAGSSSRLGRPKQALPFDGKTLLQHTKEIAADADVASIIVVLGANAELLQKDISTTGVRTILNDHWAEGMASSITCGVKDLLAQNSGVEGLVLMVCDQPYVTASLINELITVHQNTAKPIVTCSYADTFGPPTFFHKSLFPELMELTGDVGARSIIKKYTDNVEVIPFPEGVTDVDTEADYEKVIKREP